MPIWCGMLDVKYVTITMVIIVYVNMSIPAHTDHISVEQRKANVTNKILHHQLAGPYQNITLITALQKESQSFVSFPAACIFMLASASSSIHLQAD